MADLSVTYMGLKLRNPLIVAASSLTGTLAKLKAAFGVKSRMASAEETLAATGFKPGGVCPFGVEGIEILLDRSLADYGTLYPAAGTDSSGVPLDFETLKRITGGRLVDCCDSPGAATAEV